MRLKVIEVSIKYSIQHSILYNVLGIILQNLLRAGMGGPVHRGPQPTPERPRCIPQACCKVTVPGPLPAQPCRVVGLTAGSRSETVLCCRACGREQGQWGGLRVWAGDHPSLELDLRVRTQ